MQDQIHQTDPIISSANPVASPAEPVIDDVGKSTKSYIWKNDKMLAFFYCILVIAGIAVFMYTGIAHFLVISLIISTIGYGHVKSKFKHEFTQQFGASIGFAYSPSADMSSVNGKLFSVGHGQKIFDVLSGAMNGRSSRLFSYQFIVSGNDNSHTYSFTVFETAFSNDMPDIVLSTHTFMSLGAFPGTDLFDGSESVKLEGDFNKYFTLKVPKGYETDAYEIFPPNVMADLIDKAKGLNFEFNGNKLYVYAAELVLVREKLQAMFDLAEYLDNLFARSARAVDIASTNL